MFYVVELRHAIVLSRDVDMIGYARLSKALDGTNKRKSQPTSPTYAQRRVSTSLMPSHLNNTMVALQCIAHTKYTKSDPILVDGVGLCIEVPSLCCSGDLA